VEPATPEPKKRSAAATWTRRALLGTATLAGLGGAVWYSGILRWFEPSNPKPQSGSPSETATTPAEITDQATARGQVSVAAVAAGIVRIQITPVEGQTLGYSYAIPEELPATAATVSQDGDLITLHTDELQISVARQSGAISAQSSSGETVIEETENGFVASSGGFSWRLRIPDDETCHGLGQRALPLSLRGRTISMWNYDAGSYPVGADPLYLSVPFYLGQRNTLSYGIFWDNPARGSVDLDSAHSGELSIQSDRGPANLYLIVGSGPQQVVERFTSLVGRMELPPLWALGYHQSRWSYPNAARFRSIAAKFRQLQIPCDALHFDIDYMNGYRLFTWNRAAFPAPKQLLSDLRAIGFHGVAILDPGVKVDSSYPTYTSGRQGRHFLAAPDGGRLVRDVWAGASEFPDFTAPAARAWWSGQVRSFAANGFDGLWNDMDEPSTFDDAKTLPDLVQHSWEGDGNTHVGGGHAVYGMQMARATREGLTAANKNKRPFVITRAGYAGVQRYATTWNGDSLANWDHLRMSIAQLCNLGISGIPFSGSDAGGFRGDPSAELYLRWMQVSSMMPFFRTHSARTAQQREPWSYGTTMTNQLRGVIERRYQLLPYLYTQVQRATVDGSLIVRPMFFERPDDPAYRRIEDQFLLGDSVLVAPILAEGARSRMVTLPPGTWYRYGSGTPLAGGRTLSVTAGLDLPIFVRAGTVLPLWPVRQSTSQPVDRLILQVYRGQANSRLYEDEGDGFGYRDGKSLLSTFVTSQDDQGLTVKWTTEGSYQRPASRVEVQLFGWGPSLPHVSVDDKAVKATGTAPATITTKAFTQLRVGD